MVSCRQRGGSVQLITRSDRKMVYFPLAGAEIEALSMRSCVINSETIVINDGANGIRPFPRSREAQCSLVNSALNRVRQIYHPRSCAFCGLVRSSSNRENWGDMASTLRAKALNCCCRFSRRPVGVRRSSARHIVSNLAVLRYIAAVRS
jgi:hypothetical protein